jgi:hypothetical protein
VVLSNQATDKILGLYKQLGFDLEIVDAPRRISCTGDRTPAKEVIASRNLGSEGRHEPAGRRRTALLPSGQTHSKGN